jgi:hypothetical protein
VREKEDLACRNRSNIHPIEFVFLLFFLAGINGK